MARPLYLTPHALLPLLMGRGPVSARDMAEALRVNRSSVVRALERFQPGELLTVGARRSTRYLLRRPILAEGNRWPLYLIEETGLAKHWGTLESVYPQRWRMTWEENRPAWADHFCDRDGLWEGFPFFLQDIRPQGFVGRAIARRFSAALGVPADPAAWSDDHTLVYLCREGDDVPGALVVGDAALQRAQTQAVFPSSGRITSSADRLSRYPVLARDAALTLPGSSAGGEQPKFLTNIRSEDDTLHPVLVKFSPPFDQPGGRRWADLLACEAHALDVLAEQGLAVPASAVCDAGDRRFLEVPRFDRNGAAGRRSVVSLGAIHPSSLGASSRTAWIEAATKLHESGLIDAAVVNTVQQLHAFGALIGNSDMHAGNLAFWLTDSVPFRLAPAYDMLPMLWAPGVQGEVPARAFTPAPPLPSQRGAWQQAAAWADTFWQRVAADSRISPDFAPVVDAARHALQKLRAHAG